MGLGAIAVCIAHWIHPAISEQMAASDRALPLDARIRSLRTGDLVLQVVDSRQQPVVGAIVNLQQTAHAFEFGTALSTEMFSPKANPADQARYLSLVKQLFNSGVHENALKWYATEPAQGRVSYEDADRILNWSDRNGLTMRGHTLFWEVERWNQPWVKALSKPQLQAAVQRRTTEICRRYRGKIPEYDVLNEMLHGNFFRQRLGAGIVKQMFEWCRAEDPTVHLYVNDYDLLNGKALDRYVQQIRDLQRQGVPIGGIGVQAHIREPITVEQIQRCLDALAVFKLPIKLTEVSVVAPSEAEQTRILTDLYQVAFAHPAVTGILLWGFWEGAHWEPKAAIFKQNFSPTPSAQAYRDLVLNQWWTAGRQTTDQAGKASQRAFFGKYEIKVTVGDRTTPQTVTFSSKTSTPQIIKIAAAP